MGEVDVELVRISTFSDSDLKNFLKKNALSLTVEEARKIVSLIGRDPSLTEIHIFNIQWSEHSSYKSSRHVLKMLPTSASNVIQGPEEDAGILYLTTIGKERYGVVFGHESHNHPSQVVPYEGAATGVGGILRDVLCMGARIVATGDALRFGNPYGKNKNYVRYIANAVVDGIAGYGNPVGIPILAGDVYFNDSFDENCLVNAICLGIIKEKDIIHSKAPKNSEGFDVVIVGKATDNSGFGGAAFASLILDENDRESNKGAVQVPDPFLKNVLIRATYAVFDEARKHHVELGFKDMGAGGIMCSTSEMGSDAGMGIELDLDNVHTSMNIPPFMIACSETQERFTWICPPSFTKTILRIYNEDFELPKISQGAQASVIGKVTTQKDYVIQQQGKVICHVPIDVVTRGIRYDRKKTPKKKNLNEPDLAEPSDYHALCLDILQHPNVASKRKIFNHYDTSVLGNTVIKPGEADAGLIAPLDESTVGIALTTDCNPKYSRIDPYWGAVNAVAESMRNVAAIGASPSGLTDCLNYGNPEKEESFYDFCEGVRGVADAARQIKQKETGDVVPVISGNVSFYNESKSGNSVDGSAIIACLGIIQDYRKAITMKIKKSGSRLFSIGERKDELGGSVYYDLQGHLGKNIPQINFKKEQAAIYAILECINEGYLLSCHDISDGGIFSAVAEMVLGGDASGSIGARINLRSSLRMDALLFSESSGFVFEVSSSSLSKVEQIMKRYGVELFDLGVTGGSSLVINGTISFSLTELRNAWTTGIQEAMK